MMETLDLGWDLLSVLPREELSRIDEKVIESHYNHGRAVERFHIITKPIIHQLRGEKRSE